jgi:hypothetical protein
MHAFPIHCRYTGPYYLAMIGPVIDAREMHGAHDASLEIVQRG